MLLLLIRFIRKRVCKLCRQDTDADAVDSTSDSRR